MNEVEKYFVERFGIDSGFEGQMAQGPKGRIYLGPSTALNMARVETPGLPIARINANIKPSTNFIQRFGRLATKNVVEIGAEKAKSFARGDDMEIRDSKASNGYVIVKYKSYCLGCGLMKDGVVKNMLPTAKRLELEFL